MMMQSNLVHEGERLDELQRNGYGIIQNPARFCFGMDAVLLSGFAKAKAIARHEVLCTLDDILRESAKMLMPGGRFYMVHRPFRLAEIMSKMVEYKIEPKRMRLVYPYIDKEPNMVLIEGLRGGKSRVTVEKPLIVYKEQGVYTDEIYDIYGY